MSYKVEIMLYSIIIYSKMAVTCHLKAYHECSYFLLRKNNQNSSEKTISSVYIAFVDLVSSDTESVVEVIDISSDDEEVTPTENEIVQPDPSDDGPSVEGYLNQASVKITDTPVAADEECANEQELEDIADKNLVVPSMKFAANELNNNEIKVLDIQEISNSFDGIPSSQASN